MNFKRFNQIWSPTSLWFSVSRLASLQLLVALFSLVSPKLDLESRALLDSKICERSAHLDFEKLKTYKHLYFSTYPILNVFLRRPYYHSPQLSELSVNISLLAFLPHYASLLFVYSKVWVSKFTFFWGSLHPSLFIWRLVVKKFQYSQIFFHSVHFSKNGLYFLTVVGRRIWHGSKLTALILFSY